MNNEPIKKNKSIFQKVFELFLMMFPSFYMIKDKSKYLRIKKIFLHKETENNTPEDERTSTYLNLLIKRNNVLFFILLLPYIIATVNCLFIIKDEAVSINNKEHLVSIKISNLFNSVQVDDRVYQYKQAKVLACAMTITISILVSLFLSLLIKGSYGAIVYTKKLKQLIENSFPPSDEGKERFVFYTPVGCLVDISGQQASLIATTSSIWNSLNMKLDHTSYVEDPENGTMVVFIPKFELPKKLVY